MIKKIGTAAARYVRSNSFELSDSDQNVPSNLKTIVLELQEFFPSKADDFAVIDRLIEDSTPESNEDEEDFKEIPLYKDKLIASVRKDMRCLEMLKTIRSLVADCNRNSEVTNWDLIVKEGFKVECYQSFIYTLMRQVHIKILTRLKF